MALSEAAGSMGPALKSVLRSVLLDVCMEKKDERPAGRPATLAAPGRPAPAAPATPAPPDMQALMRATLLGIVTPEEGLAPAAPAPEFAAPPPTQPAATAYPPTEEKKQGKARRIRTRKDKGAKAKLEGSQTQLPLPQQQPPMQMDHMQAMQGMQGMQGQMDAQAYRLLWEAAQTTGPQQTNAINAAQQAAFKAAQKQQQQQRPGQQQGQQQVQDPNRAIWEGLAQGVAPHQSQPGVVARPFMVDARGVPQFTSDPLGLGFPWSAGGTNSAGPAWLPAGLPAGLPVDGSGPGGFFAQGLPIGGLGTMPTDGSGMAQFPTWSPPGVAGPAPGLPLAQHAPPPSGPPPRIPKADGEHPALPLQQGEEIPEHERTTVMLRNIPNKYTQRMLLTAVHAESYLSTEFDFFYLPIDFRNKCNVGYCFVNFLDHDRAVEFFTTFDRFQLRAFNSQKVCSVSWARVQGREKNVEHYRNSPVAGVPIPQYRPLLFDDGEEQSFPEPDGPLSRVRLRVPKGSARHRTRRNAKGTAAA